MMMQKTGPWLQFGRMLERASNEAGNVTDRAVAKQAALLAGDVKKNITSGGALAGKPFKALKPSTIARKGSSKPLIDTSDMRNSLSSRRQERFVYFVGIPGDMRGGRGNKSIAEYAMANEFGAVGENGELHTARPFFGPTIEAMREKRLAEIQNDIRRLFKV